MTRQSKQFNVLTDFSRAQHKLQLFSPRVGVHLLASVFCLYLSFAIVAASGSLVHVQLILSLCDLDGEHDNSTSNYASFDGFHSAVRYV